MLADEPVSALDPTLADMAVGVLIAQGQATGATLVASLHAVDLALKWFPRIVGMRAGEVSFDLPAQEVTQAMLQQLYASEGHVLPMQGIGPSAWTGSTPASDNVVPLPRPGCR
jgi:phosphonate transport system ATP-binding protein